MTYAIGIIVSYLLGSIPFGYLLAKMTGKGDLRKVGSGGTGATNVMRVGGFRMAALTWILDMAKAIAAVFLGWWLAGRDFGALCGLVAVIGHCYPVWLKFHGGKGISSMFGIMLAINPLIFVTCGIEWLIVSMSTGYSSAGAIISFLVLPVLGFAISTNVGLVFCGITLLTMWRHRANIKRLIAGTESKIEWKWKK